MNNERVQPEDLHNNVDFVGIFHQRLRAIPPFPQQEWAAEAWDFQEVGITGIKRKAVGVLFDDAINTIQFPASSDLWIEDPRGLINRGSLHSQVVQRLEEFAAKRNIHIGPAPESYYLIQDDKDDVYLVVNGKTEENFRDVYDNAGLRERYVGLMERYGIKQLIGDGLSEDKDQYGRNKSTDERAFVVDLDLIYRLRQNAYFVGIAKKYGMTNLQLMRFRAIALGAREAGQLIWDDQLAREIVSQDPPRSEFHPTNSEMRDEEFIQFVDDSGEL